MKLEDILGLSLKKADTATHSFKLGRRLITLVLIITEIAVFGGTKKYIRVGRAIRMPGDRQKSSYASMIAIGRAKNDRSCLLKLEVDKLLTHGFANKHMFNAILFQLEKEHRAQPQKWLKKHIAAEVPKYRRTA